MRPPVRRAAFALLVGAVLAACAAGPTVPPDSAPPDVVLTAYLTALVAGDCSGAHALALPSFTAGNGDLCGAITVSAFTPLTAPATPYGGEVVYATTLTVTRGSDDGSVVAGDHIRFYQLDQQPNGAWRLTSGGSGP